AKDIANKVAAFYYEKYLKSYQYPKQMVDDLYLKYNWDKVVKQYAEIFRSMMSAATTSNSVS
ncbi:MAG TPA: hypothetical protein VEB42_08975, partial [Chitinophagaceae bacterium]|nr:hypothetical protein [Chitinophagaceae bacterium]